MKRILLITAGVLVVGLGMFVLYSCGPGGGGDSGTVYYADADGDGFGDVNSSQVLDTAQAGWVLDSTDCDDDPGYGASINPAAAEACDDWTDNNCDDLIDCYDDASCAGTIACLGCNDTDADGYYEVAINCSGGNDCADADSMVNPGVDTDGDTLHACQDCDDMDSSIGGGTAEVCNGLDDDCDWIIDEGFDVDNDGYTTCDGDCDDSDPNVHPGAVETCNAVDDDCDLQIDEPDSAGCSDYYLDNDEDAYGVTGNTQCLCEAASPYTALIGGDCDDNEATVHPDAEEVCNGVDDDCDSQTDEPGSVDCVTYYLDQDDDGYGDAASSQCLCAGSGDYTATNSSDCYDQNFNARPGQTGWYTSHRGDGSYDYDCDETDEQRYTESGSCSGVGCSTSNQAGWYGSVPDCGVSKSYINFCYSQLFSCNEDIITRTQSCR